MFLFYMNECFASIFVCTMCVQSPQRPEDRSSGSGNPDSQNLHGLLMPGSFKSKVLASGSHTEKHDLDLVWSGQF